MPHKFNASRRHKIGKKKYRVTNWGKYNESLRNRGNLRVWITADAQKHWTAPRRESRGIQPRYSDLAITLCLTLGTVCRLALRQTQGLMHSIAKLMKLGIPISDFSTLSRRGRVLNPSTKSATKRTDPVHLVVDSTGLKIFGEGALSAACCACACRVINGYRRNIKQRPNINHGASFTLAWTLPPAKSFVQI